MVLLAKKFGWTYEEMMDTPVRFLRLALVLDEAYERGIADNAKHRRTIAEAEARNARALR